MADISRRHFLQSAAATMAVSAMSSATLLAAQPPRRRPNVLLIITDDQGTLDANCYGSKDLVTPNIDSLARRGVKFNQFYASAAICSPSRASILTGRYPQRAQDTGNGGHHPGERGMPTEQVTIAEMMKPAGYATAHIGKWHLGYVPDELPNAQGFDYSFGFMAGCIDSYSHFYYWGGSNCHDLWRNGKEVWHEGEYFGDLMVREATGFMEANKDRPWFMYWATNKPHYPLQGKAKWRDYYKNMPQPRNMYAASISTMDEEIGQLLAKLDELKLREDTIIIFQSDQGHSTEDRTFGGGGNAGPYRGAKFSFFEGGVRIPAIISWPGKLPEDQERDQACCGIDWLPTIAALTGVDLPSRKIDGASLADVAKSPAAPAPHKELHWMMNNQWAVREGDWKLIANPTDSSKKAPLTADDKLFLANLAADPGEMKNLAKANPQVVQRLQKLHQEWAAEVTEQ